MKWGWIIFWFIVALLIWKHPASSGHAVNHAWTNVSTFIGSVFG